MKVIDITGQRFGRLTAMKRVKKENDNLSYWECQCDCGKIITIYLGNLRRENTRSCGCLHRDQTSRNMRATNEKRRRFKTNPELGSKYSYYIRNAKVRNISWELTTTEFETLVKDKCKYCGTTDRVGVDRVSNSTGYNNSNTVPCCTACNQAKNDRSVNTFASWVEQIYKHLQAEKWSV